MFAKSKSLQVVSRAFRRNPAEAASHRSDNDNHACRPPNGHTPRLRRPVLVRRWRVLPDGALECSWHIEATGLAATEEPEIRRLIAPPPQWPDVIPSRSPRLKVA